MKLIFAAIFFGTSAFADCTAAPGGGALCSGGGDQVGSSIGQWQLHVETDVMTDAKIVAVRVVSAEILPSYVGRTPSRASLTLWCSNNSTIVQLDLGGWFVANSEGFGRVDYRLDGGKAAHVEMEANTTNDALLIFGGKRAIPFIKGLFGREQLLARAAPFNESPMNMTFPISQVEEAVKPLRAACNW